MKQINFITTLSPHKQYAIKRWFRVTFLLSVSAIVVSMFFIVPQLLTYISLKNDIKILREKTKDYAQQTQSRDALKKEYEQVRAQSGKIDTYHHSPKNPHVYITTIMQACGDGVMLESINIHKKNCDITVLSPTAEHATVFIKRLSASELFKNVKLVSLQQDTQAKQLRCVVKSMIV